MKSEREWFRLVAHAVGEAAQQVAGADLAVENPLEAGLLFAALQVKFGDTAPAAWRLSSRRWAVH